MPSYKLGKKPATALKKKAIRFGDVFDLKKLPQPPQEFGFYGSVRTWDMLGNDEFGDCVWASKAHCHSLWSKMGGHREAKFTTENVLADYAAQTGFDPRDPNTDQGTDMKEAAEYHRKIGVVDKSGKRRRVTAYVNNTPGNLDQLAVSAYIFGAVEIGVLVSKENMKETDAGKPWTKSGNPMGGHCVPIVGRDGDGNFICITWGMKQLITPDFLSFRMDEAITFMNDEILTRHGLTQGAFNRDALNNMLRKISPVVFARLDEINEQPNESIRYGAMAMPQREPNADQLEVAFQDMRAMIDKTGYGWMVKDSVLRPAAEKIARDIVQAGDDPTTEGEEK
jgi:hypothetical protein